MTRSAESLLKEQGIDINIGDGPLDELYEDMRKLNKLSVKTDFKAKKSCWEYNFTLEGGDVITYQIPTTRASGYAYMLDSMAAKGDFEGWSRVFGEMRGDYRVSKVRRNNCRMAFSDGSEMAISFG